MSLRSVEFAFINLGQNPPIDSVSSFIIKLVMGQYSVSKSARLANNYSEPMADVNLTMDPDANGDRFIEFFRRPGTDYTKLLNWADDFSKQIGLMLVHPFAANWKLFKAASLTETTDKVFLLGDQVIKKVEHKSRGTYAGDEDDICYSDDIAIVGEEYDSELPIKGMVELSPQSGPFYSYYRQLRGLNAIENGTDNPIRRLSHDPRQVWFRVEFIP